MKEKNTKNTKNTKNAFLGEGRVLIDILDTDGQTSLYQVEACCRSLELSSRTEIKRQISYMNDSSGQVSAAIDQGRGLDLRLTVDRMDSRMLALALGGQSRIFQQAAGRIDDLEMLIKTNNWLSCGKFLLDAPVLRDGLSGTAYVPGEDFCVRSRPGLLRVIEGSTLAEAAGETGRLCVFSCNYGAIDGEQIFQDSSAAHLCRVFAEGRDRVSGRHFLFSADQVYLAPDAEVFLIAAEFAVLKLAGPVLNLSYRLVFME